MKYLISTLTILACIFCLTFAITKRVNQIHIVQCDQEYDIKFRGNIKFWREELTREYMIDLPNAGFQTVLDVINDHQVKFQAKCLDERRWYE